MRKKKVKRDRRDEVGGLLTPKITDCVTIVCVDLYLRARLPILIIHRWQK